MRLISERPAPHIDDWLAETSESADLTAAAPTARTFYAVLLSRDAARIGTDTRWNLFEVADGRLVPIWPGDAYARAGPHLLPLQVFSTADGYPAFHFKVPLIDGSPLGTLAQALAGRLACAVRIVPLNGRFPPGQSRTATMED